MLEYLLAASCYSSLPSVSTDNGAIAYGCALVIRLYSGLTMLHQRLFLFIQFFPRQHSILTQEV